MHQVQRWTGCDDNQVLTFLNSLVMNNTIVITTTEELRAIISEAINSILPKQKNEPVIDTITLDCALELLEQHGFPTSKAKMYKLTSTGKYPAGHTAKSLFFHAKNFSNGRKAKPSLNTTIRKAHSNWHAAQGAKSVKQWELTAIYVWVLRCTKSYNAH